MRLEHVLGLVFIQFNFSIGAIVASVGMHLNPFLFALIRECAAGIALSAWAKISVDANTKMDDLPRFLTIGTCVAGTQLLSIVGLSLSNSPLDFALWQPTQPIAVAAASVALGWETPKRTRLLGIASAVAGCVISAVNQKASGRRSAQDLAANGFFAASCACGASYQLFAKTVLDKDYPSICVAAWCYCVAAVEVAIISLVASLFYDTFWSVPYAALPPLAWWIVMSTVINYALQVWAIKHSSPTIVTASSALQPVFTAGISFALLTLVCDNCVDAPNVIDLLACVLVILGLALVLSSEPHHRKHPSSPRQGVEDSHPAEPGHLPVASNPILGDQDNDDNKGGQQQSGMVREPLLPQTTSDEEKQEESSRRKKRREVG